MGVIHKLREDVVSFIITLKRDNPSVGVRQLASLTREQFQVKVSKSSVNSVLKSAELSSAVGRRPGSIMKKEKFTIPEVKKKQISKSMSEAGFLKKEKPAGQTEEKETFVTQSPAFVQEENTIKEPVEEKGTERQVNQEELPDEEIVDPQECLTSVKQVRRDKKSRGIPIANGAGFVFLKAAQWNISDRPLVAELFKKYIKGPVSQHFYSVSDMFLFFKFLGLEEFDHVSAYRGHGLWVLNNFCDSIANEDKDLSELQQMFQWEKEIINSPSLADFIMEYKQIKEQALLEVKGFKLLLEDKTELAVDASMFSFLGGGHIPSLSTNLLPIHKAMARLSNCLISNIQSAIFHKSPGEDRLARAFYDMVAVFENIPGKRILQISVIDRQDEEIAGFSTVPFQRRTFMVGIGPHQKEFREWTKAVKWTGKKSFYHAQTDTFAYFCETKTGLLSTIVNEHIDDYRVISLWSEKEGDPCWAILTNQQQGDGKEILKAYIDYWPCLKDSLKGEVGMVLPPGKQMPGLSENIDKKRESPSIFAEFVEMLHGYCQDRFFPPEHSKIDINHSISSIYGVSGVYLEEKDYLKMFLDVEEGSPYYKTIQYAVKKVNESHILDYSGRRLWLEI